MRLSLLFALIAVAGLSAQQQRYLYVAVPSDEGAADRPIELLVFDIADGHRFVKRVTLWRPPAGAGETVRGIAAHSETRRLYISTTKRLAAVDLKTDQIVWQKSYEEHCCDRIAVSPDGQTIYAPAFESPKWFVVNAATGELRATIDVMGWPRETHMSSDGRRAVLASWESTTLAVADTATRQIVKTVGPFSAFLCPLTLNRKATLVFANIDGLVGFEVGDLDTGLILDSVEAPDYDKDAAAEYECPSHGIAFNPDETQLWVADGVHNRLHLFDAKVYPPTLSGSINLSSQPRSIVFSADGRYAYPSTGDIVEVASRKIVGSLKDDRGQQVGSESVIALEIAK